MDSQSPQPVATATPTVVTENPQIETASEEGRVIAGLPGLVHPGELPVEYSRRPLPFAARFQAILIVVMFATFLLSSIRSDFPSWCWRLSCRLPSVTSLRRPGS